MIKSFRDLEVYQISMQLADEIEWLVRTFPEHEKYLLCDQMRRASRAIPSLIAEAWPKRRTIRSFRKYLKDALGECNEMMSHLEMADRYRYIKRKGYGKELIERYDELGGKISKLSDNWQNY